MMDCSGPGIRNLRVTDITDQRLTVRFDTEEPGDTVVEWGMTPSLGEIAADPAMVTDHAVTLDELSICSELYLRVSSTDTDGNTTVLDMAGVPRRFASMDGYSLRVYMAFVRSMPTTDTSSGNTRSRIS